MWDTIGEFNLNEVCFRSYTIHAETSWMHIKMGKKKGTLVAMKLQISGSKCTQLRTIGSRTLKFSLELKKT